VRRRRTATLSGRLSLPSVTTRCLQDRRQCRAGTRSGRAEALDQFSALIEMQDRIEIRHLAGGRVVAAVGAAAVENPDRLAVLVDVNGCRRSPLTPAGILK
jgi:hypothetical protein